MWKNYFETLFFQAKTCCCNCYFSCQTNPLVFSLQFFCQNSRYFLFSEVFTGYRELLSIFSLLCITIIVLFSCITITRRMLMTLSKSGMNCGSSGEVCTTETRDPLFAFSRSIFLCFSQMQLKFEL